MDGMRKHPRVRGSSAMDGRRSTSKVILASVAMLMVLMMAVVIQAALTDTEVDATSGGPGSTAAVPHGIDYLYVIKQNTDGTNIQSVDAYEDNGGVITKMSSTYRSGKTMGTYWNFNAETGMGPFNSFYAAINISSGDNSDDSGERRLSKDIGKVAYVLDPNNLKKTLNGYTFTTSKYNVMLIIPSVYWKSVNSGGYNYLYLSNKSEFGYGNAVNVYTINNKVTGLDAYAHKFKSNNTEKIYPYIALGVYETSLLDGKLVSQSGKSVYFPSSNQQHSIYYDKVSNPSGLPSSKYQIWNFYQWTLYKMMGYTVMGTKNSQAMLGTGPTSNLQTGSMDNKTPYSGKVKDSSASGTKLFLENTWGRNQEFVADAYRYGSDHKLFVGNELGGNRNFSGMSNTGLAVPYTSDTWEWVKTTYTDTKYWDFPKSTDGTNTKNDLTKTGSKMADKSYYNNDKYVYKLYVGFGDDNSGLASINTTWVTSASTTTTTRLCYVMSEAAFEVNIAVDTAEYGKVAIDGTEISELVPKEFAGKPTYTVNEATTSMVINYLDGNVPKEMTITASPTTVNNPFQGFVDETGNMLTGTNVPLGGMKITALFGPNKVEIVNPDGGELKERLFATGVTDGSVFNINGNTLTIMTDTTTSMIVTASDGEATFGQFAVIKNNDTLITEINGQSFYDLKSAAQTGDQIYLTAIFFNKVFFYRGDAYTITTSNPGYYTTSSIGGEHLFLVPYGMTPAVTSTLNSGQYMRFFAGISEITGNNNVYVLPAVTSDTYLTILSDNQDTVTFTDDNAQYVTDHTIGSAMIPTSIKITPKNGKTITYPMIETVSGRTWMSIAVLQSLDVDFECTTSDTIWISNQVLGMFQGMNGSLKISTLHGSAYMPSSDVFEIVSAIIGMSPTPEGQMSVGIYVSEPPASLAGCKAYKMEADVNGSPISGVELYEDMTVSLKNEHGLAEDSFSVYVLSGDSKFTVPHRIVGDSIIFDTAVIGTYVLSPNHTISWTSGGTTNTNMKVYADGVEIASGASIPFGAEITVVPSNGYSIYYAKYNGNQMTVSNNQASFVMPDQDAVLDVSILAQRTVLFDVSGKGSNFTKTYLNGERLGKVQATTTGFELNGWYTDKECTDLFPSDSAVTRSMTLYAGWTALPGHSSGYPVVSVISSSDPTPEDVDSLISEMESAYSHGQNPYLIFNCEGKLTLPSELTRSMIENNAKLVYEDRNVRIAMSRDTLSGLGTMPLVELTVTKVENPAIQFPAGKTGLVYDISLKVDGKEYKGNFVKPLDATIDIREAGSINLDSVRLCYINGSTLEEMSSICSSGVVSFDPPHLSQYAIIYDSTALVSVDLNGGYLTSESEGWKYSDGKYVKYFAIGTPVGAVLEDLGQYDLPGSIALSVSSNAIDVTSDGLTIQVQWLPLMMLAVLAIVIVLAVFTVFLAVRTSKNKN